MTYTRPLSSHNKIANVSGVKSREDGVAGLIQSSRALVPLALNSVRLTGNPTCIPALNEKLLLSLPLQLKDDFSYLENVPSSLDFFPLTLCFSPWHKTWSILNFSPYYTHHCSSGFVTNVSICYSWPKIRGYFAKDIFEVHSPIFPSSFLENSEKSQLSLNNPPPCTSVSWAVFLTAKSRQWITTVRTGTTKALTSVYVNCRHSLIKQMGLPRWGEWWVETFVWHKLGSYLPVGLIIWSVAGWSLFLRTAQYCDKRVACQSLYISRWPAECQTQLSALEKYPAA